MENRRKSRPPPIPTLGQLRQHISWAWLHCDNIACRHRRPIALTPLIIRWTAAMSSERLRKAARCTRCGRRGASLQHPSWVDMAREWAPFPVDRT
jgi:hypothetical protein